MRTSLIILAGLLAAPALNAQEVKGSLTTNGVTKPLTHVCAHEIEDPKTRDVNVVIVLSDRALTRAEAISEAKLEDLMRAKKLTALRVVLDANARVRSAAPYSPAMRSFVSTGAYINWTPSVYSDSDVSGRVKSWDDAELAGERWSYDLLFVTPITLAPGSDPPKNQKPIVMKLPVIEPEQPAPAPAKPAEMPAPPAKTAKPTSGPGLILSLVRGTGVSQAQITVSIRGGWVRNDMGPESTTITDTASGDLTSLMHPHKMASRMSGAALKALMEQSKKDHPAAFAEPPPPVKTDRVENIGAQECAVYTLSTDGITSTFWIAPTHPWLDLLKDELAALEASGAAVLTLKGVPGLVMQSSTKLGADTNFTLLTGVRRTELEASLFAVPADYKTMSQ